MEVKVLSDHTRRSHVHPPDIPDRFSRRSCRSSCPRNVLGYRTHVGDRGMGLLQQRVHGVVDVYGAKKLSYELLRRESSPIDSLAVEHEHNKSQVLMRTRRDLPLYTLRGYKLRGLLFGEGNIPLERQEMELIDAEPGSETKLELTFTQSEAPIHVQIDVLRPTSFSTYTFDWKP